MSAPTEIEKYAMELLYEGGESIAEDDANEDEAIADKDHGPACDLSIEMAHTIRDHQESFLAWFRRTAR